MSSPIIPAPREAVLVDEDKFPLRGFGGFIRQHNIDGVVKDPALRRPVTQDNMKFGIRHSSPLFRDNEGVQDTLTNELFKIPTTVPKNMVHSSPLVPADFLEQANQYGNSYFPLVVDIPDFLLAETLFNECVQVNNCEEDLAASSNLFTPHTTFSTDTPFMDTTSLFDTTTSLTDQDFSLFDATQTDWHKTPLFVPSATLSPYIIDTPAVTSASPAQFHSTLLPSPELSPPVSRKRKSFAPITPAPTVPNTPLPVITRATKRRIPVVGEDPSVVEKRRRNTIAAQRSRQRKALEKMEDKDRITTLETEIERQRRLLEYWRERAVGLGASPLEDGETGLE
jgi:Basic region leucine zipper